MKTLITLLLLLLNSQANADFKDWWMTPDQQGQRLYDQGQYAEAAKRFTTPERIGAALFKAGEFEPAAAAFGRAAGPEAAFNRGNALIMLGSYDSAISSYATALELKPGWKEAEENQAIAIERKRRLEPPEDDAGGTGGQLGADEIVLDDTGRVANSDQEQVIEAGDESLSEEAMRALWLRRVDTRPADFLGAKFNYQLSVKEPEPTDES